MVLVCRSIHGQVCNLEIMVINGETEILAGKLDIPMCFKMLHESDIWIGDSGASSHSTKRKKGAVNKRQFGSASLGHTREIVNATSTINVSG